MIIAIDGPAGSGKSTVAKSLATRDGLTYLDTGAMYRAVTWACLEGGVDVNDADAVARVAVDGTIDLVSGPDGAIVSFDGHDITHEIRSEQVDANVSTVASIPAVRTAMVSLQRSIAADKDVVAEGRDIGTVVFPEAEVKVFLTADVSSRAHRRAVQREGGDTSTGVESKVDSSEEHAVARELQDRDRADSTRAASPLVAAADAVHIDSTYLSVDEVCTRIETLMGGAR